ncbi:hypothetical protein P4C99_19745 [Pontiellaceae bacterium B1224]|nr:hypothetical protein [Pontiellaceae bacterium B1224]
MKKTWLTCIGILIAISTFAVDYRVETKIHHSEGRHVTTYTCYDDDVECIKGEVVLSGDSHLSTTFQIIYQGEAVAWASKKPGYDQPRIILVKHASQHEGVYQGRPFIWINVWDRIDRRAPLPGSGHYIIDSDGHIRKPKPEERIAIWESQKS